MGNSQSIPELPPTYDEFQKQFQSRLNYASSCGDDSPNSIARANSYSASSTNYSNAHSAGNTIRSNTISTASTIQAPSQPLHSYDPIEAKLSALRGRPDTLSHLLNCKKEDYDAVKNILEMERNISKRKEKLENYIIKEMKKIEKMEKERDKKLIKININSRRFRE
ncbi:hypothetical protein CONCODRAFT_132944 [Conidiobolus coronatus NRRL 28638]|uniref:Uncharacterized protein n=1 Tax=Conidiobolus coronatus (strain ATCC 28846 / CBS 209.66 / NRRL 28638) TaxID=796925 RepID=A0A137PBX0_CONC2|nr:hypothetical protein CONCODRAFT_132944 [Conidiobolus coronatus NRRL 28638]|eukprot:KXN72500.1 hypothetical protein CONCODRAFT_132944 [Conidiobolus coronatus NRRL 28638]